MSYDANLVAWLGVFGNQCLHTHCPCLVVVDGIWIWFYLDAQCTGQSACGRLYHTSTFIKRKWILIGARLVGTTADKD